MNIPFLGPREKFLCPLTSHLWSNIITACFGSLRTSSLDCERLPHDLAAWPFSQAFPLLRTHSLQSHRGASENLLKIAFIAFPQEIQIARMLVNLPCAKDMFGQLTPIGSRVPGGALVVGEHDRPVGGLTVPSVLDQVFPGQKRFHRRSAACPASKRRP